MAAFEDVLELIREKWQPQSLQTELKFRDSLAETLRKHLRDSTIEKEYRHHGTTIDIYVRQRGFFGSSEVFVELKRKFVQKTQLDRLIGQVESLQPGSNKIIVVFCDQTNEALVDRFKEKYDIDGPLNWNMAVVVKKCDEEPSPKKDTWLW